MHQTRKMYAKRTCLVLFLGVFVYQTASKHHRITRSPDKVVMELPEYTSQYNSSQQDYQGHVIQEAEYWQGEKDRLEDKGNSKHEEMEANREKTQEEYEKEKIRQEEQQEQFNKEVNESYQNDKDKIESYHENYQGSMYEHGSNLQNLGNGTRDEVLTEVGEKGDHYGEKGTEYTKEKEEQIANYEVDGKGPSITYDNH